MEETKIETVNEATSDNVEEVKEAPKRRGRKPKVESTEEVKLENTVQEVQPEFTVEEFIDESNTEESKSDPLVLETEFEPKPEPKPEAKDSHEESDESLEELCTLPSSINLTKPIMFYASPTLHRASGFVKGTLIIKEELQKFVKVQFVIPELGRTAGYVLKSDLVSRM